LINLPTNYTHEKLYRKDNVYDLVIVLNYNIKPTIKNKGSAIFIHITKNTYKKTKGCIALNMVNLIKLISEITKNTKVKVK
jgi:L,D-peptidoglycan transpeptidase YkuD (ErfK/YbiS/YcfS/YnhG family)